MSVELNPAEVDAMLVAMTRPGVPETLDKLGLVELSVWPRRWFVPEENLPVFRRIVGATEPKGEPGRPDKTITQAVLLGLFERGLERARSPKQRKHPSYASIADEYGLSRTWITPIVQWAEKHQRAARRALVTSETPARFSTLTRR
jgi:hypothetical protein